MATTTTASVLSTVATAMATATAAANKATPQAGVLEGQNPTTYNASNPILLFIIQAGVIIIFCRLLHYPLKYLGQPRVIAEVIGGILLGPSVMMRIPGFQAAIFPAAAMPVLNNVANLGLILFLFLTGLEVDIRLFLVNWRVALSVGLAGMMLPFGLGCTIAWGLYNNFRSDPGTVPISFGVYALFIGTALAITAFPVLCRILTELKLLGTSVGVTVLAAGVGNDVTGWVLLALCVALVNNASGLAALWALLCCLAWVLLLVFVVRPAFIWILRRSGSLQNGPTQGMVALTVLLVLTSAWFTGIVGIHPIFGGFLIGIICPHDGGFAIKLTEKLEDFVSVLFLPLYFALSGLSTNLGLLNDGITWAYVVAVIAVAFSGKIVGGTLAARFCNLRWRESLSIGVLMSCKGLVELIVLNVGLQAQILSVRTFTIFVVMALVTTVSTTPLTKLLYPLWYQQKLEKWRRGEIDWEGNPLRSENSSQRDSIDKLRETQVRRLLVQLRLDSLPGLFTFISLLAGDDNHANDKGAAEKDAHAAPGDHGGDAGATATTTAAAATEAFHTSRQRLPLEVHGLRLLPLTDRHSSVMQVTSGEEYAQRDPVVNTFRTFSRLNDVAVSGRVAVVPVDSYAETLTSQAAEVAADWALIPWSEYGSVTEDQSVAPSPVSPHDRFHGRAHLDFEHRALADARCNTAIFINCGFGGVVPRVERPSLLRSVSAVSIRSLREPGAAAAHAALALAPVSDRSHRVFLPFVGGVDDRAALRFVLQLAKSANVSATVAHFSLSSSSPTTTGLAVEKPAGAILAGALALASSSSTRRASKAAAAALPPGDDAVDEASTSRDAALLATLQASLPGDLAGRVTLVERSVASPTKLPTEVLNMARLTVGRNPNNAGDLVVVGQRHPSLGDAAIDLGAAAGSSAAAAASGSGSSSQDLARTIGVLADQVATAGMRTSILVVRAGGRGLEW